jgi:hypothetical protein
MQIQLNQEGIACGTLVTLGNLLKGLQNFKAVAKGNMLPFGICRQKQEDCM